MNETARHATTAIVVLLVVSGCAGINDRGAASPGLGSSSTSSAGPSSPSGGPEDAIEPVPAAMWGDWHAEVDAVEGVTSVAQPIRASFNWEDGRSTWVQLDHDGQQLLRSTPLAAPAGEIHLRADADGSPCAAGDRGRYRWTRSADGLFLTLELIEDVCAPRAAALARTWVHSLSAVNDGGVGVFPSDPWIQVMLPHERFAMGSGGTDATDIKSFDESVPFKALIAVRNPMGFRSPCEVDQQPFALASDIRAFEAYARNLPGLELDGRKTAIDGLDALAFKVTVSATFPCKTGEPGIFRSSDPSETDATWGYGPGDTWFMASVVNDRSLFVFTWEGSGQTAADAEAIFESIRFFVRLPTP